MATLIFDTHESVKELVGAGFSEKRAEAIVNQYAKIINENLATKDDHELLKKDLILKLGTLIVSGFVATIGIILAVVSIMLSNIVV